MPFKSPKGTSFAASGSATTVTIVEIESGAETEVSAQFGLISEDESGKIKGHRFVVSRDENIMGKDVTLSAGAVSIDKALDAFITQEMRADPDDYEYEGTDDEYFEQKYTAPKEDKDDVWGADRFKDSVDELEALRGQTEDVLAATRDAETSTQGDYLKLAEVLSSVYAIVKTRKALKAWAMGRDGEGANMPLLAQLGKGDNALTEAMRLAQITDVEYSVLPVSITSGKGVDRHAAQSVKSIVEDAAMNKLEGVDLTADVADINGVEHILRHVAHHAFGVSDALEADADSYATELASIVAQVDAAAGEYVAEFNDKFGKHINTYDKASYEAAKRAFGAVRCSTAGAGLFKAGVDAVAAYDALADDDAEGMKKVLASLFTATGGNMLIKEAYKAAKAHSETVAKEKANRDAVKAVSAVATDGDKAVFSKTARANFISLTPLGAAAELYALMQEHGQPDQVEAALKGLMSQGVTVPIAAE